MAKGIALHIVSMLSIRITMRVVGNAECCEAECPDLCAVAKSRKFKTHTLLTAEATRDKMTAEIINAAGALKSGDIFLLTYSGHGGQIPDLAWRRTRRYGRNLVPF